MNQQKISSLKFVVCVNNAEYRASIKSHKIYRVLPDEEAVEDGYLRVIDECGEDDLYPAEWFVAIEVARAVEKSLLRAA